MVWKALLLNSRNKIKNNPQLSLGRALAPTHLTMTSESCKPSRLRFCSLEHWDRMPWRADTFITEFDRSMCCTRKELDKEKKNRGSMRWLTQAHSGSNLTLCITRWAAHEDPNHNSSLSSQTTQSKSKSRGRWSARDARSTGSTPPNSSCLLIFKCLSPCSPCGRTGWSSWFLALV